MTLRVVSIDDIPDEGLALDEPLDQAWLVAALENSGYAPAKGGADARASLRLDRQQGRDVLLTGTVHASLETQCVRCLEPLDVQVSSEFTLHLEPRPPHDPEARRRDEIELTADELDVDYYDDEQIDLPHWVREQILLDAPAYPRHEHDCALPGASTTAAPDPSSEGATRIDPRLLPLQKFRDPK